MVDYEVDVNLGPGDSRTASMASAAGFPSANLPLGLADFNDRGFGLHMIARPDEEKIMLVVMEAWEVTFPNSIHPPPQVSNFYVSSLLCPDLWSQV
jgi:amidase